MSTPPLTFSIVIPTYARPAPLRNCLEALSNLDYPRESFEILVIDDGSTTRYDQIKDRFSTRMNLVFLQQPHAGPAMARNTAAARATHDYLAFTDDDCTPASDWLTVLAKRLRARPDSAIGGRVINALTRNIYAQSSQLLISYLYEYFNRQNHSATFFTSNNMALKKELFHKVGGFDARLPRAAAEDRELCDRWLHSGYHMEYASEAVVLHAHRLRFYTYCRQHFNYGRGAHFFRQLRARRGATKMRVEPVQFYRDLLRYPIVHEKGSRVAACSCLMFLSQAANAAGFFWERFRAKALHD